MSLKSYGCAYKGNANIEMFIRACVSVAGLSNFRLLFALKLAVRIVCFCSVYVRKIVPPVCHCTNRKSYFHQNELFNLFGIETVKT